MVNPDKIREYVSAGKYAQLLAALGYYPFTTQFTKEEIKSFRDELGIVEPMVSLYSLISSFILDVLLPPPFRPPLALILNIAGS